MARGINKVILIGSLGQAPEAHVAKTGTAITTISIATNESYTGKDGNPVERTEWHRVVFFNRLAEVAGQYLEKGSQVYVEGSIRTNKWQDEQGNDRYSTEIVARTLQMLGGRPNGIQAPASPAPNPVTAPTAPSQPLDNFSEDIPF